MKYNINEIKNPDFLKELSLDELKELSNDIRKFLIENISKTGGHLSSNLGVVELTIALHIAFKTPNDKFIFDVSHQSYIHKILTGRAHLFPTLRKLDGIAGFTNINESIHDSFGTGHSSTSISAQAGFEVNKDINKDIGHTISIIGDGSINCGLAFEGLNFLGQFKNNNPIIILNDNEMSISQNVGAIVKAFDKIRLSKRVNGFRRFSRKITPSFIRKPIGVTIKTLFKGNNILEDLGYYYMGPIDGHDIKKLLKYLNIAKNKKRPVVIHLTTKKGLGYKFAEEDQVGKWHGIGKFNIETGEVTKQIDTNSISWSSVISKSLIKLASDDKNIKVITPAMIQGSSLTEFSKLFPNRLFDVGIAESHAATMAASMALSSAKPFLSIYSTFSQRAYDQISHDIARQKAKVVLGIDRAGLVGEDGETHHGIYDIPMLNHIPNVSILAPRDAKEAFNLLRESFYNYENTIAIRYPRGSVLFSEDNVFEIENIKYGTWEILKEGNDIIIISFGDSLSLIEEACISANINATIINARFIKPIDKKMLLALAKLNTPILVYEESILNGGLFSTISCFYSINKLPVELHSMSIDDLFVEHGTKQELLTRLNLDSASVIKRCSEIIKNK